MLSKPNKRRTIYFVNLIEALAQLMNLHHFYRFTNTREIVSRKCDIKSLKANLYNSKDFTSFHQGI